MLSKKNRVDKKTIEKVFKEGKVFASTFLTFRFIETQLNKKRISFIVPKNIAKLAVKRNSLRRRGYAVSEKYLEQFPFGLAGVFVFKKFLEDTSIIENEIKNILAKFD